MKVCPTLAERFQDLLAAKKRWELILKLVTSFLLKTILYLEIRIVKVNQ